MHWLLQEDDEGLIKFEDDGKLAEDQAVRFTANSIIVADIEAKNDKVKRWCVRSTPFQGCLLYTSPSPRDKRQSRMPSSA